MKEKFLKLTLSEKVIVVSAFIAFISFLFNWVSLVTIKKNGFQEWTFFLLLIYVYPIFQIYKNKVINKTYGYLLAIIGILLALNYIQLNAVPIEGELYSATGLGPFIFIFACAMMLYGVWKYKREE